MRQTARSGRIWAVLLLRDFSPIRTSGLSYIGPVPAVLGEGRDGTWTACSEFPTSPVEAMPRVPQGPPRPSAWVGNWSGVSVGMPCRSPVSGATR